MRVDIGIYKLLSGNTDVTDIVSTNIFPTVVPQTIKADCISYIINDLQGADSKDVYNGYAFCNTQINCFHSNPGTLADLTLKVRSALERQSGTFGTGTTVKIDNIFFGSIEDLGFDDDFKKFHKAVIFTVWARSN
jgi:hypothetical protein